jgi:hypothetical protein
VPNPRILLVLLPVVATVLTAYSLRPRHPDAVVAPLRLAMLRGGVAVGAVAVAGVETLSAFRRIDATTITGLWVVVVAIAAGLAKWRWHRESRGQRAQMGPVATRSVRDRVAGLHRGERVLLAGLGGLILAELVLAIASQPNTWDSNHYHLPKVEHWVARHDVELYATTQLPQVILAPGAEYLLLHLRLLTGGDGLYGLVQWGAGVGGLLAVSRIAAQIGAGAVGQLLAASVVATAPMVVLQSTSTQTDLTAAAWLVCTASFVLDDAGRRTGVAGVLSVGAAAGLTAVTKSTGLLGLAPLLLLWGVRRLRIGGLRGTARTAMAGAGVVAVALLLVGPFLIRLDRAFGEPLGPSAHREGLSTQRHDPAAVLVNGLRIGASTLVVPVPAVNAAVADGVKAVSRALGMDPQDRAITHANSVYPNPRWRPDEDHSPFPVQSALVLLALTAATLGRRVPGPTRAYAVTAVGVMLLFAAMLKWQVWGNRLVLPALVVAAPVAGWWLARLVQPLRRPARQVRPARRWARGPVCVALAVTIAFVGGYGSVLFGWPRRLAGTNSVFVTDPWEQRFARQIHLLAGYRYAAGRVDASGARRIGTFTVTDNWEYPWWRLLPGREFVSLATSVPGHPAATLDGLDAYVCVGGEVCPGLAAAGWRYESVDGWVGVGLPGPVVPSTGWQRVRPPSTR